MFLTHHCFLKLTEKLSKKPKVGFCINYNMAMGSDDVGSSNTSTVRLIQIIVINSTRNILNENFGIEIGI